MPVQDAIVHIHTFRHKKNVGSIATAFTWNCCKYSACEAAETGFSPPSPVFLEKMIPMAENQCVQKILIIDDTPDNIRILNEILRNDYRVFFATNGEHGLEIAGRELPDIILLDILMPEMDGYEVCARLKSDEATQWIPVIFVTAMVSVEEEAKGLEAGAIDYITKPFSPPIVKNRIRNHLKLKSYSDAMKVVTEILAQKNRELDILAKHDGLTGLANRRYFDEAMASEIRRAHRSGEILSLILCDIDYFKRYNDHYGHIAGDDCLRHISEIIRGIFQRSSDLAARYGGEEFVVILPDTSSEGAERLAEKLRLETIAGKIPHACSDVSDYVTLSLGVASAVVTDERLSVKWLTEKADSALYRSKDSGRNRVTVVSFK